MKKFLTKDIVFTLICFSILNLFCFCACNGEDKIFSLNVTYIDVGEGNSVLINVPNKYVILIDCGGTSPKAKDNIKKVLTKNNVTKINMLIASGPLETQIFNYDYILDNFVVDFVYLPKLTNLNFFPLYKSFFKKISEKKISFDYNAYGKSKCIDNFFLFFVTPFEEIDSKSSYVGINSSNEVSYEQMRNISPVIYFSFDNYKFLFCGEITLDMENEIIEKQQLNLFAIQEFNGKKINLSNFDFVLSPGHGKRDCNSQNFIDMLAPKNAIFSLGSYESSVDLSTEVLKRYSKLKEQCTIKRTDVFGTIELKIINDNFYFSYM